MQFAVCYGSLRYRAWPLCTISREGTANEVFGSDLWFSSAECPALRFRWIDNVAMCQQKLSPGEDRSYFQGSQRPPLMFANYGGSEISPSISFISALGRWL